MMEKSIVIDINNAIAIKHRVVVLCSDEPSNYGSLIYRTLSKCFAARQHFGNDCLLWVDAEWIRQTIIAFYPSTRFIEHRPQHTYHLAEAIVPTLPSAGACVPDEIVSDLNAKAKSLVAGRRSPLGEKIYVSRRLQAIKRPNFRVLENETELVLRLMALGFSEFIPESHDFITQLLVFSSAKVVVFSGGSAVFNAIFCTAARFIIDIESSNTWLYAHQNMLSQSGVPFSVFTGVQNDPTSGPHSNWRVDVDALVDALTRLQI